MKRTTVESSNIAEIGYEESSQTLEVQFLNGNVYQYFDIPSHIAGEFISKSGGSHGKYLNSQIKGRYRFSKV